MRSSLVLAALVPLFVGCKGAGPSPGVAPSPAAHRLVPSPTTVAWGYYWSDAKPVLRVKSGEAVDVGTLITSSPERLERAGVAPAEVLWERPGPWPPSPGVAPSRYAVAVLLGRALDADRTALARLQDADATASGGRLGYDNGS